MFTMTVRGIDQLADRLIARGSIYDRAMNLKITHMQEAVSIARMMCPVATGYMQSQIQIIEINPDDQSISGGVVGVPYAIFVEFGTSRMNARPFWRPAAWEAFFRLLDDYAKLNRGEGID